MKYNINNKDIQDPLVAGFNIFEDYSYLIKLNFTTDNRKIIKIYN
jgi:hypothetical protein